MNNEKINSEKRLTEEEQKFLYNLAVKNFKTGSYRRALPVFQFLVMEDNRNFIYLKSLAACYHALNDYWLALITYEQCLDFNSVDSLECNYYIGMCYFELASYASAKTAFQSFLDGSPNNDAFEKKAKLFLDAIEQMDAHEAEVEEVL